MSIRDITNRKEFIEHFQVKVVPCGRDKKPYGKWNEATVNPMIETDCYACFAGGTRYEDGVIVVIDLDSHSNKEWETGRQFWDRQLLDDETFTVRTPSGGEHIYFLATETQIAEIEEISRSGTQMAEQVEIFWNGRHLNNGAFSITDMGEYRIEKCIDLAPLPDRVVGLFRLYEESKRKTEKTPKKESSVGEWDKWVILRELLSIADEGTFEDYSSWLDLMLAMRNSGFSIEEAKSVSWANEETGKKIESIWNEPRYGNENEIGFGSIIFRWVPQFSDKKWKAERLEEVVIDATIEKFSFLKKIRLGSSTGILDLNSANKVMVRDYKNTLACYQSKEHRIDYPKYDSKKGDIVWKEMNGFDLWWKEAEALEGLKTVPYKPMGEVEEAGFNWFNDWEEAPVKDGRGTQEHFWEHIRENICDGDESVFNYVQHWIWDLIANPQHKNNIALAITGKQGSGKSSVFKALQMCFHPKYSATIDNTEQLTNRFDGDWKSSILVAVEEACFAGDRRSGVWGKMKSMITDTETSVERKNYDRYKTVSMLHFIISGNDAHIVPKERGDRRYLVLECNDNRLQDTDFFSRLFGEMENGGAKKLIDEAKSHAEEALCFPFHRMPITTIGVQNVRESADFVLQWLIEQIESFAGDDDSIFTPLSNGDIAIRTKDVLSRMKEDGNTGKFSSITLGKKLKTYFGMEPKQMKIDGRNSNGFRFSGVDEVKQRIRENYFGGHNPFSEHPAKEEDDFQTEEGQYLSGLEEKSAS